MGEVQQAQVKAAADTATIAAMQLELNDLRPLTQQAEDSEIKLVTAYAELQDTEETLQTALETVGTQNQKLRALRLEVEELKEKAQKANVQNAVQTPRPISNKRRISTEARPGPISKKRNL